MVILLFLIKLSLVAYYAESCVESGEHNALFSEKCDF